MSARFLQRADMIKVLKECQVKRVRVCGSSVKEFHHLRLTIAVHAQASVRGVWRGEVAHQGGDALGAVLHSGYATRAPFFVRFQRVVDRPRGAGADAVNPVDAGRRRHAHCTASSCGADEERREIRRQPDAMQIFVCSRGIGASSEHGRPLRRGVKCARGHGAQQRLAGGAWYQLRLHVSDRRAQRL